MVFYVSHKTKSCILQILNLKYNVNGNLFAEVVEKPFKALKFIFNSQSLIGCKLLLYRYLLRNQRLKRNKFLTEPLFQVLPQDRSHQKKI